MASWKFRTLLISGFMLLSMYFIVSCEVPCDLDCGEHGTCLNGACLCDSGYSGDNCENPIITSIIGTYSCVPNPCETIPCLPGVVLGVVGGSETFHLTVDGQWIWDCSEYPWSGHMALEGDIVQVEGVVSEDHDTRGSPYYNIEVISISPFPY